MDRMSPLDASFLHIEDAVSHMHIGSVAVFEGPPPTYEEFEAMVAGQAARPCRGTARRCGSFRSSSAGRSGSTIRISTSAITCATPRSRRPAAIANCATSSVASCRSNSTGTSRCGRCGWSRGSSTVTGRWSRRCTTAWSTACRAPTCSRCVLDAEREPAPPLRRRRGSPSPNRATSQLVRDALVDLVASPYEQLRAARSATRAPRQVLSTARRARAWDCARVTRRRSADARVVDQRPDRSAPPLGLGAHDARRREDRPAGRSAAR